MWNKNYWPEYQKYLCLCIFIQDIYPQDNAKLKMSFIYCPLMRSPIELWWIDKKGFINWRGEILVLMFKPTKPFMRSNAWITSLNIWSSFAKLLVQQCSRYLSIKLVALPHQTGGAKRQTVKKTLEVLNIRKKLISCLGLLLSTNLARCREKPILATAGWPSTWSCWAPTIASTPSSTLVLGWPG